jgi:hypothetical protein
MTIFFSDKSHMSNLPSGCIRRDQPIRMRGNVHHQTCVCSHPRPKINLAIKTINSNGPDVQELGTWPGEK